MIGSCAGTGPGDFLRESVLNLMLVSGKKTPVITDRDTVTAVQKALCLDFLSDEEGDYITLITLLELRG